MTTIDMTTDYPLERARPEVTASQANVNPQFLARLTGLLFVVTFASAIPPVVSMYVPVLSDPAYIVGSGRDAGLTWGAILELILILANVGTAVALYPVLKRQSEMLSLSYVAARLVECAFIGLGLVALLAVGTLRLGVEGVESGAMIAVGQALVAVHDWTFRLGPGVVVGIGNGLILGYLMWRSKLVPRALSILGLIGGPLILVSGLAVLLGTIEAGSQWQTMAAVPEFFWELGLGLWLMVKGFDSKALEALTIPSH